MKAAITPPLVRGATIITLAMIGSFLAVTVETIDGQNTDGLLVRGE